MKKIKKIGTMVLAAFLFLYTKSYADTIDPGLERKRLRELNKMESYSSIDFGEVLKLSVIGILIILLIAIVVFTIYKIVKSSNDNKK